MSEGKDGAGGEGSTEGRRAFFRSGFKELTEALVRSAKVVESAVGEVRAAAELAEVADIREPAVFGERRFHLARVRGGLTSGEGIASVVRPPGAVVEAKFLDMCERCHR